jgi:hypothetical protein
MDEQDDEARRSALNPLDDWAVDASPEPEGPRCPWCSAPLPDAAAERCDACGAHVAGAPDTPIPGLTTVAPPSTARSAPGPATPQRRSVLAWITGDEDLVEAARAPAAPPTAGWIDAAAPGGALPDSDAAPQDGAPPTFDATQLGPTSSDALAPPDARLRREMLRVQLEAMGLAPNEEAPEVADDGAPLAPDDEAAASDPDRGTGGADAPDAT